MKNIFKSIVLLGITVFSIQIIGKVVFEFNFYETIIIEKIVEPITGKNPITVTPLPPKCEKPILSNSPLPWDIIDKDGFCINFYDYKRIDDRLEIDFYIRNNGQDNRVTFYNVFFADERGNTERGEVQLASLDKEMNFNNYSSESRYNIIQGVTIKGKMYVEDVSINSKQVSKFRFCWKHNRMRDINEFCEESKSGELFDLPKRTWSK